MGQSKRALAVLAGFITLGLLIGARYEHTPVAGGPAVTGFAATISAPDSTVTLGTQIFITGALVAGWDTVRFDYYRNDTLQTTKRVTTLSNKVTAPAPAYGVTATYKGCAQV